MRFIDLGTVTPEYSVCVDKVLLSAYSEDTLILYSRDRPCVSVGRFQKIEDTVNIDLVKKDNVSVVRRISGGSNIYSDEDQLTYSVIVSKNKLPSSRDGSFAVICGCVVNSLKRLGMDAEHKPVNDILVRGRKISGGAQARNKNAVLQHGSLILNVNDDTIKKYLIDKKKRSYDGLTSMKECLGRVPSRNDICAALVSGFSETFGPTTYGELTDAEKEMISRASSCSDR
jgi:lipoate-protein ligase A